jgi:hypothetical protein
MSETGHAKNLTNFDELVSFVSAYGTDYKPTKTSISLEALKKLSAETRNSISALNAVLPAYSNAVAAREVAFKPLSKLITRVMNALKAVDTSSQVDDNAKTLVRKIQGLRATAKRTEEEKNALAAEGNKTKEISSSQMSFDSRLENLDKLIKLLSSIPLYAPNEEDLKTSALTVMYTDLMSKNTAVVAAAIPVSNARIARNTVMYKADTGLVDTAAAVKAYIKSLFGAASPQHRQVSKLAIKTVKI